MANEWAKATPTPCEPLTRESFLETCEKMRLEAGEADGWPRTVLADSDTFRQLVENGVIREDGTIIYPGDPDYRSE